MHAFLKSCFAVIRRVTHTVAILLRARDKIGGESGSQSQVTVEGSIQGVTKVSFSLCVGGTTTSVADSLRWTRDNRERRKIGMMKEACQYCHKEFPSGWQLKRHENIHLGIKPFKCRVCRKAFMYKDKCLRHEKIHYRHLEAYMIRSWGRVHHDLSPCVKRWLLYMFKVESEERLTCLCYPFPTEPQYSFSSHSPTCNYFMAAYAGSEVVYDEVCSATLCRCLRQCPCLHRVIFAVIRT